jgi:hypothetical protein
MTIFTNLGTDVRGLYYNSPESIIVEIQSESHQDDSNIETIANLFTNLSVWFTGTDIQTEFKTIVLWQGEHN